MTVDLTHKELANIIEWHWHQQYLENKKENYGDADYHKKRAEELIEIIKPVL